MLLLYITKPLNSMQYLSSRSMESKRGIDWSCWMMYMCCDDNNPLSIKKVQVSVNTSVLVAAN